MQLTYHTADLPPDTGEPPAWQPAPDDIHTLRYGYNLADIDRLARMALSRTVGNPLDHRTRYEVAWSAIAEALYAASEPPTPSDLIYAAQRELGRHTRQEMRHHGHHHRDPGQTMRGYAAYWNPPAGDPLEDVVVNRTALWQIWPRLTDCERQVLLALATTGDYAAAADALAANPGTFRVNLRRARRRFLALWHEGETPPGAWGTDRRVGTRARANTSTETEAEAGAPRPPGKRKPVTRLVKQRKGRPTHQLVHGRATTYTNHGCRCEPCTRAATEKTAAYRRAKGIRPRRRITADQLEQIRRRRAAGESVQAIAAELGFASSYLYRLLNGTLKPAPSDPEETP